MAISGKSLEGKNAIVTGASSGIGRATAWALAARGARVGLLSRNVAALEETAAEMDGNPLVIRTDVAKDEEVAAAVERADAELGGIDITVNSAGIAGPISLQDLDGPAWRETIETNLSGSYYVARETGLRMAAGRGGSIVSLGSEFSVRGAGMLIAYCAAKSGILGMTRALASELAPKVRVNAVCPGAVGTPMFEGAQKTLGLEKEEAYEQISAGVPLGRVATPEEIADAVLFMATDASYATGTALYLDGGTTV